MKQLFISFMAMAAALCIFQNAGAKDKEDEEYRHVIVTLASGEKIDGYLSSGWHAEYSLFKPENWSFKISATPDGKEKTEYTADDVISVEYTETTENNPDGTIWESHPLAYPNFASRYNTMQRMFCVEKVGENATIYWWKIWVSSGMNGMGRSLQTNYGIRFHNDPEGIVYPYYLVNSVVVEPRYPGLKKFCKDWFKGPDKKKHNKEADESPAWILDMYDAYLAQMGDAAADLPYPIVDKKAAKEKD